MVLWAQGTGNGRTDLLVSTLPSATLGNINCLTRSEMKSAEEWEINYFQNKLAFQRGAFWKQKFGNVFIIKLFCCLINANTTPAKAFISTHLKNLETQFSSQLKNLPNEEFQWVSNHLLEILKYSTLQLMCKNNKLMQGKIEIDDVDFNENFCIINV